MELLSVFSSWRESWSVGGRFRRCRGTLTKEGFPALAG